MECLICRNPRPSKTIPVCPECSKNHGEISTKIHEGIHLIGGGDCKICSNRCKIDDTGLCKVRYRDDGMVKSRSGVDQALLYAYLDPLPTNCCNAWFCKGSRVKGYNLAIFYYGCNFDCLYCQNWSHRNVEIAETVRINELIPEAMRKDVRCICHFGGSPEPQIEFATNFSRKITELRDDVMICWEWNGAGNRKLALKAGEISHVSGGTVKFDLKAWNPDLHKILTGRSNEQVLENFSSIFHKFPEVVSATTLLVPYYVDNSEVEEIARFIASHDESIPYSLLIFHPDDRLKDLPVTPKDQVFECYKRAKKHLKNVNIGNLHLLGNVVI